MPDNIPIHKTDPSSPFRNSNNQLYARELFQEFNTKPGVALYTLKKHDFLGLPSLYRLYMLQTEPSEYAFATEHFDGWRHWEQISKTWWMKDKLDDWREELAIKLQAEAVANIIRISKAGGKDALTAAKYVAERGWEKVISRVGRPHKSVDILKEARRVTDEELLLEDDAQRILGANVN